MSGWWGKRCGRCGRTSEERVMGSTRGISLCHGNLDGTKADPDCFHLVVVGGEPMTWLRRAFEGHGG